MMEMLSKALPYRRGEAELRALSLPSLGPYPSAVAFDYAPDYREPRAGALELGVRVEPPLEEAPELRGVPHVEVGPLVPDVIKRLAAFDAAVYLDEPPPCGRQ